MSASFFSCSIVLTLVLGLHDLKYNANILHRDVSVNNIMYEIRNGEPFFILNDYDLVSLEKPNGEDAKPSSKRRTGTLPFMPCEVLSDLGTLDRGDRPFIPHILRYDFESLYWVSLWCTMTMEAVKDANLENLIKTTLSEWETGSFNRIASSKKNVFVVSDTFRQLPMTPLYQPCRSWLHRWNDVFFDATCRIYQADRRRGYGAVSTLDFETVDGIITKETILEAIDSA